MMVDPMLTALPAKYRSEFWRHGWLTLLAFVPFTSIASRAQSGSPAKVPEDGFLSLQNYKNAYFGFALTVPNVPNAQPLMPKMQNGVHTLFGVKAYGSGLSGLLVTAKKTASNSSEDVQKAAALGGKAAKPVTIAENRFGGMKLNRRVQRERWPR